MRIRLPAFRSGKTLLLLISFTLLLPDFTTVVCAQRRSGIMGNGRMSPGSTWSRDYRSDGQSPGIYAGTPDRGGAGFRGQWSGGYYPGYVYPGYGNFVPGYGYGFAPGPFVPWSSVSVRSERFGPIYRETIYGAPFLPGPAWNAPLTNNGFGWYRSPLLIAPPVYVTAVPACGVGIGAVGLNVSVGDFAGPAGPVAAPTASSANPVVPAAAAVPPSEFSFFDHELDRRIEAARRQRPDLRRPDRDVIPAGMRIDPPPLGSVPARAANPVVDEFPAKPATATNVQADGIRSLRYQTQGDTAMRDGDLATAEVLYRAASDASPDRRAPLFRSALAQMADHDFSGAASDLKSSLLRTEDGTSGWIPAEQLGSAGAILTSAGFAADLTDWLSERPGSADRLLLLAVHRKLLQDHGAADQLADAAVRTGLSPMWLHSFNDLLARDGIRTVQIPEHSGSNVRQAAGWETADRELPGNMRITESAEAAAKSDSSEDPDTLIMRGRNSAESPAGPGAVPVEPPGAVPETPGSPSLRIPVTPQAPSPLPLPIPQQEPLPQPNSGT